MKLWGILTVAALVGGSALFAAGCAAPDPRGAGSGPPLSTEGRQFADRLKVDTTYRPAPTGGECVCCFIEFPPGAYVAQGWWYGYWCPEWPLCPSPAYLWAPSPYAVPCAPASHCGGWPGWGRGFRGIRLH